jgi:hypothetical protein
VADAASANTAASIREKLLRAAEAPAGPRHAALLAILAAAQACLIVPWVRSITFPLAELNPLALVFFTAFSIMASTLLVRAMEMRSAPAVLRVLLSLAGLSIIILLGLSLMLHPGKPIGEVLSGLGERIVNAEVIAVAEITLVGLSILAWWVGLSNARRWFTMDSMQATFRAGVIVWLLFLVFNTLPTADAAAPFIAGYFMFALIALALARSQDLIAQRLASRSPFGARWFMATSLMAFFLVGLSLMLWAGIVPPLVHAVWDTLTMAARLILVIGIVIIALLGGVVTGPGQSTPAPGSPTTFGFSEELLSELSKIDIAQAAQVLQAIIGIVAIIVVARLLIEMARRHDRPQGRRYHLLAAEDGIASMSPSEIESQAGNWLQRLARQFRHGPSRWLAAMTIRRIYAQTAALGKECGVPRPAYATPYEYLPTLTRLFPGVEPDLEIITGAYVRAHYGELPDTPERLGEVRDAFRRVRAEAKTVIDYNRSEFIKSQESLKQELRDRARQDQKSGFT